MSIRSTYAIDRGHLTLQHGLSGDLVMHLKLKVGGRHFERKIRVGTEEFESMREELGKPSSVVTQKNNL